VRQKSLLDSKLSISTLVSSKEPGSHNEVQVVSKARRFTAKFKQKVLKDIDVLTPSERGAYLRKNGLYSSHIWRWRKQLEQSPAGILAEGKPGRKATKDPNAAKILQLERENERLNRKLKQAETIIEVQKKLSDLLGLPMTDHQKPDA